MATTAKIEVRDQNPEAAVQSFLASLLEKQVVDAVLTLQQQGDTGAIMPALIRNPEQMTNAAPLAPAFPLNAAKMLSRLTHGEGSGKIAALLRPCEARAFVELIKLNQGSTENLLLLSMDCYGAFDNTTYSEHFKGMNHTNVTLDFLAKFDLLPPAHAEETAIKNAEIAKACKACELPNVEDVDVVIGLAGMDLSKELVLVSKTAQGEALMQALELEDASGPIPRDKALKELREQRITFRDAMFQQTAEEVKDLGKLATYLSGCVNCYNCRVACPVCYCRECVFVTDVFDHKPWQYMSWAEQDGAIKMPTDTVFFHLTRLAHMSTACVGCGQCSNACPNNIPVMELFRYVSSRTQQAFDYEPGRDVQEKPPLSFFQEQELSDVITSP